MVRRPFPAGTPCIESRSSQGLQAGESFLIADASSAKIKSYGSLPAAWALFGALLQGADWQTWSTFKFVGTWSSLSRAEKLRNYSEHGCRELNLFLMARDPELFKELVLPMLHSRLSISRAFIDEWMIAAAAAPEGLGCLAGGEQLEALAVKWTAPNKYATLNVLECILLAAACGGPEAVRELRRLARDMRVVLRASGGKAGREREQQRFEVALTCGEDLAAAAAAAMADAEYDLCDEGGMPPPPIQPMAFGGAPGGAPMASIMMGQMAPMPAAAPPAPRMMMAKKVMMENVEKVLMRGEKLSSLADRSGAIDDDEDDDECKEEAEEADEPAPQFGDPFGGDMEKRLQLMAAPPAFHVAKATKQWAESGWYRRQDRSVAPDQIAPKSIFWADFADHLASLIEHQHQQQQQQEAAMDASSNGPAPLLSRPSYVPNSLHLAACTASDALLAMAVLGLPWKDVPPASEVQGTRLTLSAAPGGPCVIFARQTQPASMDAPPPDADADAGSGSGSAAAVAGSGSGSGPAAAVAAATAAPVVVMQRLVDPFDNSSDHMDVDGDDDLGGEGGLREVLPPLLTRKIYALQVTVTNSTRANLTLDLMLQAPEGSVALLGRPAAWASEMRLGPFGTKQQELLFYFPAPSPSAAAASSSASVAPMAGFAQFPAAAARKGKLVAVAMGVPPTVQVLERPPPAAPVSSTDVLSWRQLCESPPGLESDAALLRYLSDSKQLPLQDLNLIRWRLKDAAFFRCVCQVLRSRRMWPRNLWQYAVLHGSQPELSEYLSAWPALLNKLGPCANTPLVVKEECSKEGGFEMKEFFPLINPRVHELGGRKAVLNQQMKEQWERLLNVMARKAVPTEEDLLQAACFLVTMDRFEEAEQLIARLPPFQPGSVAEAQLHYLRLWLLLASPLENADASAAKLREAAEGARVRAQGAATALWTKKWTEMAACLSEAADAAEPFGAMVDASSATAAAAFTTTAAAVALPPPALSLLPEEEGGVDTLVADFTSISELQLSVYLLDLELLFSAQPFGSGSGAPSSSSSSDGISSGSSSKPGAGSEPPSNFSYVRPSHSLTLSLAALPPCAALVPVPGAAAPGSSRLSIHLGTALPALRPNASVMVQVSGGGIEALRPVYRSMLVVRAFEKQGVLQVTDRSTGQPVPAAYVKVFSRPPNSSNPRGNFHKDGYTDRRGRFDYFSLTTGEGNPKYGRLALLVSHPELGSLVQQVVPPPH